MCLHLGGTLSLKGKGNTQAHYHAMLIRKFSKCANTFHINSIYANKDQEGFIRLIMGLGGHDNRVRDEFLANVEL